MITFECSCGKKLRTKDEAAGKRVKCPSCGKVVEVPAPEGAAPAAADEEFRLAEQPAAAEQERVPGSEFGLAEHPDDEAAEQAASGKTCPKCHVPLLVGAVICTTCGFDLRTGKVFEPPKTLMEKIPWRRVGRAAGSIIALAIVVVVFLRVQKHIQDKQTAAQEGNDSEPGSRAGSPAEQRQRKRFLDNPPAIHIRPWSRLLKQTVARGFAFQYDDGRYTPKEARDKIREKVFHEARGRLLTAHLKVLRPDEAPPGGTEKLTLLIALKFGMAYKRVAGKLVPKEPYVASCEACLLRKGDVAVWAAQQAYAAPRPGVKPTAEELKALAGVKSAKIHENFEEHAQKTAAAIVGRILNVCPAPSYLAKMLADEEARERRVAGVVAEIEQNGMPPDAPKLVKKGNQYVISALARPERLAKIQDAKLLETIIEKAKNPQIRYRASKALRELSGGRPRARTRG